jgi:hypothetical protein
MNKIPLKSVKLDREPYSINQQGNADRKSRKHVPAGRRFGDIF